MKLLEYIDDSVYEKKFKRKIRSLFHTTIIMYHETPINNLEGIKKYGLRGESVFGTLGKESGFVFGHKAIIKIEIPIRYLDYIGKDMRYNSYAELLSEHPGLIGADISFSDNIPVSWIKEIRTKR